MHFEPGIVWTILRLLKSSSDSKAVGATSSYVDTNGFHSSFSAKWILTRCTGYNVTSSNGKCRFLRMMLPWMILLLCPLILDRLLTAPGNRRSVTELDGTLIEWAYDDAYRLESETRSGSETAYTYDATGNRLSMTQGGLTTYYVYNTLDQLRCTRTSQGSDCVTDVLTQYTYDGRGNLDTETTGGITTTYTFDARDLLTGITIDSTSLEYTYDAGGRRISQTTGSTTTSCLWDEF